MGLKNFKVFGLQGHHFFNDKGSLRVNICLRKAAAFVLLSFFRWITIFSLVIQECFVYFLVIYEVTKLTYVYRDISVSDTNLYKQSPFTGTGLI